MTVASTCSPVLPDDNLVQLVRQGAEEQNNNYRAAASYNLLPVSAYGEGIIIILIRQQVQLFRHRFHFLLNINQLVIELKMNNIILFSDPSSWYHVELA